MVSKTDMAVMTIPHTKSENTLQNLQYGIYSISIDEGDPEILQFEYWFKIHFFDIIAILIEPYLAYLYRY